MVQRGDFSRVMGELKTAIESSVGNGNDNAMLLFEARALLSILGNDATELLDEINERDIKELNTLNWMKSHVPPRFSVGDKVVDSNDGSPVTGWVSHVYFETALDRIGWYYLVAQSPNVSYGIPYSDENANLQKF